LASSDSEITCKNDTDSVIDINRGDGELPEGALSSHDEEEFGHEDLVLEDVVSIENELNLKKLRRQKEEKANMRIKKPSVSLDKGSLTEKPRRKKKHAVGDPQQDKNTDGTGIEPKTKGRKKTPRKKVKQEVPTANIFE